MEKHRSCCGDGSQIDLTKISLPDFHIDISDVNIWLASACIVLKPLIWNCVARYEYYTKRISSLFGSKYRGCTAVGVTILLMSLVRESRFTATLISQPKWPLLDNRLCFYLGYVFIFVGCVLVLSSFWGLGFYNTFLGDYFGIYLDQRVTAFPFNIMNNPMYWGSTCNFLGTALCFSSQAGLFLSILVFLVYKVALIFEGPFTDMIYANRSKKKN